MISSLTGAFGELVKKPALLLPAFIGMGLNIAILLLTIDNYFSFFFDVFFIGNVPDASIAELPYYLFTSYFADIAVMAAAVFASFFIAYFLLFTYASVIGKKEKSVVKAMRTAIGRAAEIFWLTVFTFAAFFLYAAVSYALFAATLELGGLGIVALLLMLAWGAFGVYAFLKLAFAPLFVALEKKKIKQALAESWKWSGRRLLGIIGLLVLLMIITGTISAVFGAASDATGVDELAVLLLVLGSAVSSSYYNVALVKYFEDSA